MRELKPELMTFTGDTIPDGYKHQIRSFARMVWGDSYLESLNPPFENPAHQSLHFVIGEDQALYSAARVNRTTIEHRGQRYVVYGLGGVMTYPAFRKIGFGSWIVRAATEHIYQQDDADVGVLWTETHNIPFYERLGWELVPQVQMLVGDQDDPHPTGENVFMLFVSERAKAHRPDFEAHPVYFGTESW